jgi:putative ABC transport system substrate-binding protein
MRLIGLAVVLAVGLTIAPFAVEAQQAGPTPRIGFLEMDVASGDPRNRAALLQGLRDLGYVEGRNILIEYREAKGKPERFPALAAELVARKVDVIVAAGGTRGAMAAALAATQRTATTRSWRWPSGRPSWRRPQKPRSSRRPQSRWPSTPLL